MPKSKPDTEASAPWAGNAEKTKLLSTRTVMLPAEVDQPPAGMLVDANDNPVTALVEKSWRGVEKQRFLDMVASQLFVAGWPQHDIYSRAEVLWKHRLAHIAKGNKP